MHLDKSGFSIIYALAFGLGWGSQKGDKNAKNEGQKFAYIKNFLYLCTQIHPLFYPSSCFVRLPLPYKHYPPRT